MQVQKKTFSLPSVASQWWVFHPSCTSLCNIQLDAWFWSCLVFFPLHFCQFLQWLLISQWFLSAKKTSFQGMTGNEKSKRQPWNENSASAKCFSRLKTDTLLCVLKSLLLCFCCQHPWSVALGSVSLLYQCLRSLPAGEGKRLHGVKTSVIRIFSSNKSQCTLEPCSNPFAYLHSWVI